MKNVIHNGKSALTTAIFVTLACVAAAQSMSDEAAIVQLHAQERQGHLTGNANLVASALAHNVIVLENGEVHRMSREEVHRTFESYLKSVH
jgi:hypothetical protein